MPTDLELAPAHAGSGRELQAAEINAFWNDLFAKILPELNAWSRSRVKSAHEALSW
jgi:hypothetical protein